MEQRCARWEEAPGKPGERRHDVASARVGCAGRRKKSLAESLRDEVARAAWREEISHLDARQLVFMDESGTSVALTPLYAWTPKGQRASEPGATQPGQNHHQAFCPLASQASRRASPMEGGTDALAFETYVREVLAPTLKPGETRDP